MHVNGLELVSKQLRHMQIFAFTLFITLANFVPFVFNI